jgi:opacity protein-like surface antigen
MKRSFFLWIIPFLLVLFTPTFILADDSRGGISSSLFSLDLLAELQERDVVEKGEPLAQDLLKFTGDAVSTRLLARVGLRPFQSIELYGLIGGADLRIDEFDGFDAKMNLAYGGGINFVLFQSPFPGSLRFFLDAYHLRFTAKDHVLTTIDPDPNITGDEFQQPQDEKIRWREYVAKVGVDAHYYQFRPYGGLRISMMRGKDILSISGSVDLEEDDNVGVFGGIDIYLDPTEAVAFNLEASLADVNSIRAGFRFAY